MPTKGCKPQPVDKRYSTTTNVFIAKLLEDKTAEHKWWIWGQQKSPSCCRKEQTSPRLKMSNIQVVLCYFSHITSTPIIQDGFILLFHKFFSLIVYLIG